MLARIILLCLLFSGCRDAAEPYRVEGPEWRDSSAMRLTYNVHDDRAPVWSPRGDSIYYLARGYPPLPLRAGLLLATARGGGAAVPIIPGIQFGLAEPPLLAAAALGAERVALAQLTAVESYECPVTCPTLPPSDSAGSQPQLRAALLRVRPLGSNTSTDEHTLSIDFEGVTHDSTRHPFNVEFVHVTHTHPFHRAYNVYGDAVFRPAWSPAGDQLVFSDGLNLYLWRVGQAEPVAIANSQDGVWPAWSPDGQFIAFTRLQRAARDTTTCYCFGDKGAIGAVYETTLYGDAARTATLVVMRPDGSDARVLGVGIAPAWLPDNEAVVVARSDALWRIEVASGAALRLEHTDGGIEPAVSADGRHVAFARRSASGQHDIWVVRLP